MASITVNRVQGADQVSMPLDTEHIKDVFPSKRDGYAIVQLDHGWAIEVKGTEQEIKQQIEDAKNNGNQNPSSE